jgi:hypothetical protein
VQHDSSVVLPDPGGPANTSTGGRAPRPGGSSATCGGQHPALDQLVEGAERHPGELADVDHQVPAAADVAVHDVQPGAGVELGVLEPLGGVELAVGCRSVVEDLGQRAQ